MAGVPEGGTVRAVNGKAIATWQELRWEVMHQALDKEDVKLEVISPQREVAVYRFASDRFDIEELENDPLRAAGSGPLPSAAARRGGHGAVGLCRRRSRVP
jgi:regulator of sigma E protease